MEMSKKLNTAVFILSVHKSLLIPFPFKVKKPVTSDFTELDELELIRLFNLSRSNWSFINKLTLLLRILGSFGNFTYSSSIGVRDIDVGHDRRN